jgi:catechol 2,3-dioxygenase-like lactoylglutathione lyase family enzyme
MPMLSEATTHATLPAQDIERARAFYADKLGLKPSEENPDGLFYELGEGTRFAVFPTSGAPSGSHTQMGIIVKDLSSEVEELRANGVVFEEYDGPGLKTVNGIAEMGGTKGAWFKDSEGNLLGIIQFG